MSKQDSDWMFTIMDNSYIKELIGQLRCTEIWKGSTELCKYYNEEIQLLTDTFTEYKRNIAQVFFIGNGESSAIASPSQIRGEQ